MRKIGKKEARLVEEFNANKEHQAELQRQLRVLDKQGKEMRAELKQRYIKVFGDAQSDSHIVTMTTVDRNGYTVAPTTYDKYSVTAKIS
tara:strand:+ start:136 stop:402 length:267 start_codon:yes stop_codon:yes gene_type:complete